MKDEHTIEDIRKKAHSINCQLFEEGYSPREIEILGYYLHRIAASYLSYFTHKEYDKSFGDESISDESAAKEYIEA
jgi:hypothetical protein